MLETVNSKQLSAEKIDFAPETAEQKNSSTVLSSSLTFSVVVPVYNAESCLKDLHARLTRVLTVMETNYELIFVEDCGRDNGWEVLKKIASADPAVRLLKLSRNFGQHAAITAGITKAHGEFIIVMDCDLQDPPEDIPRLFAKAQEGFDVVLARRKTRAHSFHRLFFAKAYFFLLNFFTETRSDGEYGSFSLISKKVADAFLQFSDRNRHYIMVLMWLGFRQSSIEYSHEERHSGKSSYTLSGLLRHAFSGMFFQTTVLLQTIVYLGFAVSCSGFLLVGYLIYSLFVHSALPGWTSIVVLELILGGGILLSLGIVGLYVGQIFEQVKERPLFLIAEEVAAAPVEPKVI